MLTAVTSTNELTLNTGKMCRKTFRNYVILSALKKLTYGDVMKLSKNHSVLRIVGVVDETPP